MSYLSENKQVYLFENKQNTSLNILTLGREACKPLHTFGYVYTNYYLVHYVISGCGTFVKNKAARKVSAGEIFIIKPENVYTYTADEKTPWEYIWFSFDGELASMFEKVDDVMKVDGAVIEEMLEVSKLKNTRTEFLTGKLYEFYSSIFESRPTKNNYVKTVSDFIKANITRKLYVADIANEVNLNSRYLSKIFKKEKGISIQRYILKYKAKKAQSLLEAGFSVSETASAVGYDDIFTFSKMFKKCVGVSPTEFKSQ